MKPTVGIRTLLAIAVLSLAVLAFGALDSSARPVPQRALHLCTGRHPAKGCIRVPKGAERPPRSVNEQGGPALTTAEVADGGGLGGGPDEGRAASVEWARSQLGRSIWAYRCERFAEESYGTRYVYSSAWVAAQHLQLHRSAPHTAPPGALVFFAPNTTNRGYGHVGLSVGGGSMISALETVQVTDIARSPYWSRLYMGWAYAPSNWPGRIPPAPAPQGPLQASEVQITAPAFGSTISGTITLEASATNVAGVAFEAYYATDPASAATLGWHLLGDASAVPGGWALEWDTDSVPSQGDAAWGTINVAAVALDGAGELTGTRDYRRISVDNGESRGTAAHGSGSESAPMDRFNETTGGLTHTWSDYLDAAGTRGPEIPENLTVEVSCAVTGLQVKDGNTWWYRIASGPWDGEYYASADAFYNNGATSGSLLGTPFVDPLVPEC